MNQLVPIIGTAHTDTVPRRRKDSVDYESMNAEITGASPAERAARSDRARVLAVIEGLAAAREGVERMINGLEVRLRSQDEEIVDLRAENHRLAEHNAAMRYAITEARELVAHNINDEIDLLLYNDLSGARRALDIGLQVTQPNEVRT